jgi:allantoicase
MDVVDAKANIKVAFSECVDLANEKLGGKVLFANDDFFAGKDNLIKVSTPIFIADKYTEFGKWMDGWESRRKRVSGHDHCILQLGLPGEIYGINIDTSFFTGNFPEYASLEAAELDGNDYQNAKWTEILPKSPVAGGTHNFFPIKSQNRWTHLRFNIFPDGGIARLRVHGAVKPTTSQLKGEIDLAALSNGGLVVTANDMYFGPKDNVIFPGRASHMGEGWETRRKRGPGHDWLILKLAGKGKIKKIEIDTNHFKGNFPDRCSLDGLNINENLLACDFRDRKDLSWINVLPESKLQGHHIHQFEKELGNQQQAFSYLRLNIFPDGGISRIRVWGNLA